MKKLLFSICLIVSAGSFFSCNSDEEEYVEIVNEWLGGVTIFHHKDSLINISRGEEVVIDMRHDAEFEYAKVTDNYRKHLNGYGQVLVPKGNKVEYLWLTLKRKSKTKFSIKANKDFEMDNCPKDLFLGIYGGKLHYCGYLHISLKE